MNRILIVFLLLFAGFADASSRDLTKYVPKNSLMLIGADFSTLRTNDVYMDLEKRGRVWSFDKDSEMAAYFKALKVNPDRDIRTFVFSKYLNSYGSKGEVRLFEFNRDLPAMKKIPAAMYLETQMYRVDTSDDMYAAMLTSSVAVLGTLNEVKQAIDLSRNKATGFAQNQVLSALLAKIPSSAAVWGIADPLTRREAAAKKAEQNTEPVLGSFEHYYFYGVPTKTTANSHFFGLASGEKEAVFVNTFIIGTLTFARFRAEPAVADMLDQVNVQRNGRTIHVNGIVTKELVDAYFNGDLGID